MQLLDIMFGMFPFTRPNNRASLMVNLQHVKPGFFL